MTRGWGRTAGNGIPGFDVALDIVCVWRLVGIMHHPVIIDPFVDGARPGRCGYQQNQKDKVAPDGVFHGDASPEGSRPGV